MSNAIDSGYHYKCPLCGAAMYYSAGHGGWYCPPPVGCGSVFDIEDLLKILSYDEIEERYVEQEEEE